MPFQLNKMIALPTDKGIVFVNASDIMRCEVISDSSTLFYLLNNKRITVLLGMKECIHLLKGAGFFHLDELQLLNILHIKNKENGKLVLSDGSSVKISRRKKNEFMDFISRM